MIEFCKMEAQGNDFVIVDGRKQQLPPLRGAEIRRLCDRRLGIGCDQLLLLDRHCEADLLMRVFNSDGSEAANCGNG
ncbi:MAG: diaminopimelate epimerase, partial [Mariprofundales bacterium]|nr:diaminopimelate epimerase [Mariprofundales bacterium]